MNTYLIRTFGCQMNKHDSERVAGLLEAQGLHSVDAAEDADVIVFMTCCVRENADERLRGQVSSLKALKPSKHTGPLIAVGGCIGQRDGERLLDQLPHVDVVFGTHNVGHLPALLSAAETSRTPQIGVIEESDEFASDLPSKREHPWSAWVPITVGCDNFCTYCIVPYVRGREKSRPIDDIVAEVKSLVSDGVHEVTLLGQNVNSYGRDLYGAPRFAEVLRAVAGTGAKRIRFATSHPKDLSGDTIEAMAEVDEVMPYLHLPFQSGSDRILEAMNRSYTREHYLELIRRVRAAVPHLAISTDIIVGFPGETEDDFTQTLAIVEEVGFDQAFTFIYSPRVGTPAARLSPLVDHAVSQARLERLVEVIQASALKNNRRLVGSVTPVLMEGSSKRDVSVLTGRTPGNKVAHVPLPVGAEASDFAGRMVDVRVEEAQTWFVSGVIVADVGREG
jgi:tRNA-2-methylthio-N6-dimethylallyladenosine synthase